MTKEMSNLTDLWNADSSDFETEKKVDNRSELAKLVDEQIEARKDDKFQFSDLEKKLMEDRELLTPDFYIQVLSACDLDFWPIFEYAYGNLYDEDGKYAERHLESVQRLYSVLTGEKDIVAAFQRLFFNTFPSFYRSQQELFQAYGFSSYRYHEDEKAKLRNYFMLELTEGRLNKLEILMETLNAEKGERYKAFDAYGERNPGNAEYIKKAIETYGKDAKRMVFPYLINELRISSRDIYRYCFGRHRSGFASEYGSIPKGLKIRKDIYRCKGLELLIDLFEIESMDRMHFYRSGYHHADFTEFFKEPLTTPDEMIWIAKDQLPNFYKIDYDIDMGTSWGMEKYRPAYLSAFLHEKKWPRHPKFQISEYGLDATLDRMNAVLTPEVIKVILQEYVYLFMPEREVEKILKKWGIVLENPGEKSEKKGLFGLFRK